MLLNKHSISAALAAALFLAGSLAPAQQRDQDARSRTEDRSQQYDSSQDRDAQDRNERYQRDQDQDRRNNSQAKLSPSGWVRVATDYDNDGRYDAVETLFIYDLESARRNSRQRKNDARNDDSSRQGDSDRQSQQRQDSVTGEIQNLRTEQLAGMDEKCVIAKIETREGRTARAVLGPQSKLNQLDLSEGDRVTVKGTRGHINDRTMLIASQVSSGRDRIDIQMQPNRHLKRARGEVLSTRTVQFRGQDETHLIGKVKCDSGKQAMVNFGPQSKVRKLNLEEGDDVSLLARPGRINGESAMIAEQVRANGKLVELPRPENTTRFGNRNNSQRDRSTQTGDRRDRYTGYRGQSQDRDDDRFDDDRFNNRSDDDSVRYDGNERAALGVTLSDSTRGVAVDRILNDSPAKRSDLEQGDEIVSIDGESVDSYRDVVRALRDHNPDERIRLGIRRDGRTRTISVALGERDEVFDD